MMSQLLNEEKIFMGEIWTIFVVFIGLLAPQLNATSSLSSSSFPSRVLPSISTGAASTYDVINTDAPSTFVLNTTTPGPMEASSVNTSVVSKLSTDSSLKTKTLVLSVSVTRTFNHLTTVVLAHSQDVNASHGSTRSAMSSSSSTYILNSSVEALSTPSVILGPESASNAVNELRTSNAFLHSSVSKGNQSTVSVLGSSSTVKTSLTSVVFSTVDPSSSLSATRTFQLTQTSASNDSSVGLSSQQRTVTSILPLGTTHGVLLTSAAMTTNRTLSIGFPTNSIKSMSTYASQSVVKSSSASGVSSTVLTNTAAKSVSGSVNKTVAMSSLLNESMPGMLNFSASSVYVAVPVISTLKTAMSPAVTTLSDITVVSVFPDSSSGLRSTIQTSAVLSSVKLGVNHTNSTTVTAAFSPPSLGLNKTIISAKTTSAVLLSKAAAVSSFAGPGIVSSNIANSSSEMSRSLSRSLPVSPHLTTSQNSTGQSLSSVQLNTSSMATPLSAVDGGILSSSTVASETSKLFSVLPSLVLSHHVTSQLVKTLSVSSTIFPLHTSMTAASSSLASVTVKQPRSISVVSSSLATFSSKKTLPSLPSPVTPNRTSTGDGLIVMSSSYPCYIYYVVEKTVFPATKANYTVIPATTPKVTLDINSATNMHSSTPTVTLTHSVIMSTQRREMHSQVVSSSRVLRISEIVFTNNNIVPISSSSRSSIRPTLISSPTPLLPSENFTRVLSTDSHKVIQTDTSTESLMSSPVSISRMTDSRGATINTFKETSLLTQLQPSSFQQQSGTVAIPFVSHSVSDLTSLSMLDRTLGIFPGTTSPVAATHSVSDKQTLSTGSALLSNLSTTVVLSDSGTSSMEATNSVHDFVSAVTSVSSQSVIFAPASSIVSKMKSNGTTMAIQSAEGSVLQTIANSVETPKPNTLPNTTSTPTFTPRVSSSDIATLRSFAPVPSNSLMANTSTTTRTPSVKASSDLKVPLTPTETRTLQVTSISGGHLSSLMRSAAMNLTQVGTVNTLVVSSSQEVASSLTTHSFTSNVGELRSLVSSSFRAMSQISVISSSIATGHNVVATSSLVPADNQSSSTINVPASSLGFQASPTTSSGSVGQLPSVLPSFSGSASQDGSSSNPTVNNLREASSSSLHAGTTSSLINSEPPSSVPLSFSLPARRRRKKREVGDSSSSQMNSSEPTPVLPTSWVIQTNTAIQTGHYSVSTSFQSSLGKSQNISAHIASTTQASDQQTISSSQAPASQSTVFYSSPGRSSFVTEQNVIATSSSFLVSFQTVTYTSSVNLPSQSAVSNITEISNLKPSRTVASMTDNTSTFFIDQTVLQTPPLTSLKSPAVLAISSSISLSAASLSEQTPSDSVGTSSAVVDKGTSLMFAPGVWTSSAIVVANSSSTSVLLLSSRKPTPLPGAATSSIAVGGETLSPMSSQDSITSSVEVLRVNSSAAVQSASGLSSHKEATSSLVTSSLAVGSKGALTSTSSQHLMSSSAAVLGSSSSTVVQTAANLSSHQPNITLVVVTPSTFMRNDTLPLTPSVALTSSAVSISSTSRVVSMPREQSSSTGSVDGSTSSLALMRSSVLMGRNSTTVATDKEQPSSTVFTNASKSASSSRLLRKTSSSFEVFSPSASSAYLRRSDSLTQRARESSVTVVSSPLPTKNTNLVSSTLIRSPQASHSVVPTSLQSFVAPTLELLSSRRTSHAGETSHRTVSRSSATTASSSSVYKPPLVTISSLGICWVVYTTRLVQSTLIPTPQVNMSFTASANVSSTLGVSLVTSRMNTSSVAQVSPTESLNTSSVVLLPSLTVNASSSQFSALGSAVSPTGVSSIDAVLSTVHGSGFNSSSLLSTSIQVRKSSQVPQNTVGSVARATSLLLTSTPVLSKVPATSTTETSSLVQAVTSDAVSPTPSATEAVSSSVTVPTTPDPSLLLVVTVTVGPNTIIESNQFKGNLESNLARAYRFAKLSQGAVNATIQRIQRVNDGDNITVTFFMTENRQRIPATEAAQIFNRLQKDQLTHFLNLNVVSLPQPLVQQSTTPVPQPTTPVPQKALVSLIIQSSAGNNISIPANKAKLERNLASYYKDKKQLSASATFTAKIATILHEPNEKAYLEFYILVDGKYVNRTDVLETFKVSNVNLLTARLGFQVLVPVYIPDSLTSSELDRVVIGIFISPSQDLNNSSFRSDLANKLATLYVEGKGRKSSRRKRRSGSTSATIVDISRRSNPATSEADVTFFVFDSGAVVNGTYAASVMNRLSTGEMTTFTMPYAVLVAPKPALVPTTPTEVIPTVASKPIKWWIIPAVLCPTAVIIVIILLVCWRWKKGAPKAKVEPDTIRMLETNRGRAPPRSFDVARITEPGVSSKKITSFMSGTDDREEEEEREKPARPARETSLRRKVGKPPVQKLPTIEQKQTNPAYEEEEEEEDESVVSVTPSGSTTGLIGTKTREAPSGTKRTPIPPQGSHEPQARPEPQRPQELSEDESDEESEVSGEETGTENESVAPPPQAKHSAAQVPTVAVMSEATGPPRYPPVRFRSSVHPAPSLPPLNTKQTSLVGVRVEAPSEDDGLRGRKKGKSPKGELEQRADLERQKNKQRLRDRKRDSERSAVPPERRAWDRAQHDFDDVLGEEEIAERVITGKKVKRRRRRPPSSSVATDEEEIPHLKSYRKLKSPKTTASSNTRTRDHGKKRGKSAASDSNASSDESEIDMGETRRRMHAMLDDAFALLGPQSAKKPPAMDLQELSSHPQGYLVHPQRPPAVPRYIGGQPALPEPPPAHGRATEPTPGQRRRIQPAMPGYPAAMPHTPVAAPGYPVRPPMRPVVTRDPIVVWDPADRQRFLNQRAPPPTYAYRDPSGQNLYITPVHQQRDDMGGLVWSPYAAEDSMDALYPDLAQANYPGALGTTPPKDASFLSHLQATPPHDTILSANSTLGQRESTLGQSPQPLIKSIKDELFRLSQGTQRKPPITEL